MKKITFFILSFLLIGLSGCSSDENTYTQSELETYLIRDCQEAVYVFDNRNIVYEFDFKKTSEGNVGIYHRYKHTNGSQKNCKFIWDIEPNGNGGIVTMSFEEDSERIKVRMGLFDQPYVSYTEGPNGGIVQNGSKKLWKLDFKLKDDPFQ